MPKDPRSRIVKATRAFQDSVTKSGSAAGASYTLIGAILLFGAIGYLIDSYRGEGSSGFLLGGLLLGLVVGFYELARTIWQK
jgi:F0F1-type ATP synthase assembly protein I